MTLIADSGSTKAAWRLIDKSGGVRSLHTEGLNPYFKTKTEIIDEVRNTLIPGFQSAALVKKVFFYGAGCSGPEKCKLVKDALSECFPQAKITVEHDILAAAHATCGNSHGIVNILGTGSNSCLYDGKKIIDQIGGLGHILGDEGSGAHLGKNLLEDFMNHALPKDLEDDFKQNFHLGKEEIKMRVYEKPLPNRFLASFGCFIGERKGHPYFSGMIGNCFNIFLEKHVCMYPDYKVMQVHFVGSVAYFFSDILKKTARAKGIKIGKILPYPIEGLTEYHLKKVR